MVERRVIPREEWGAAHGGYGGNELHAGPWDEVVMHHEEVPRRVKPFDEEREWVQDNERLHVEVRGWNGFGYTFAVAPSGRIYEARGWLREGGHTEGKNGSAHAICFLGHGDLDPATEEQWRSAEWLIREGIRVGAVTPNPGITGHRNYSLKGKSCPGDKVYEELDRLRGIWL